VTAPVQVDVWFDPSCPWTWTTSRWLAEQVAPQRPLDLRWHLMSLALLNEGKDVPEAYRERLETARRTLRLFSAAARDHGEDALGPLYAAVGERVHRSGRPFDAGVATEALAEAGLPADLVAALDDASLDEAVRPSHEAGQAAVGEASGSPVVQLEGRAHFGPVLTPLPRGQEALDVFEGLRLLAASPSFSEVKRPRGGPPDAG
jgi:2-hydroxychromene-2-carboxylate isomerase